ncbi:fimbrial biogenesis outer membrane usher protein [Klebsiella oxytoca]|uniref:fimbria/pilus outer membrane usher protein n=1 Tax=Klebsiella oxytoca TaxID=571 RepID=UPI0018C45266|nr:fimbrial biogenesis outer membrane usher protein [Klebsiella oxytoca]
MKYTLVLCSVIASISGSYAADSTPENALSDSSAADDYIFEPELFRGGRFSQSALAQLVKKNSIAPGKYRVDVSVNSHFVDNIEVEFIKLNDDSVSPCLPETFFKSAGIKLTPPTAANSSSAPRCYFLKQVVKGGSVDMNVAQLRLNLSIPQTEMDRAPRGYVDPEELDSGTSVGFVNYISNYYHVSCSGKNSGNQDSAWASLSGGINLGKWQYRQLSNLNWSRDGGSTWKNIRSFLQRPLPEYGSQLTAGELVTAGRFFSGLNYRGFSLATDDRMLPDSQRGYAPVIRGVAVTNAKVSVRQNGQEIYQTTVAPGAFEITDLYPTSYSGDLDVEVSEADGSVSRFSVPFSAVPESMRAGISRYNFELGKTRDTGEESLFGDITWQRGLSNAITMNSGLRIADSYQAIMFGGVYGSWLGALGMDLTWSHAKVPDSGYTEGWMTHLSWSKTFQETDTTVSLAGYRYSTSGYRDLSDVLSLRDSTHYGDSWQSSTYSQRSRFDISLSQSIGQLGSLYLSGSTQDYRDGRNRDTQLQFGYSNSFHGISTNLSVGRQRMGSYGDNGSMQTITSLSFSIPLGTSSTRAPTLSTSWTHSTDGGDQYQSSLNGVIDEQQTASYGLNISRDQQYRNTVFSGNLQKRFSDTTVGVNASKGDGYWQASGSAQGALAIHSGGLTFGPYLGDTFALVEAKGAAGAKVLNAQQVTIDNQGYALVPSLTPYRYNRVTLDPQNMDGSAELVDSEKRVAPLAGSVSKVVFRTRSGTALLIKARLASGESLPPGSDVLDEGGNVIGMAGQGGQIYVRSEKSQGHFVVRWGDKSEERCTLPFDISGAQPEQPMVRLSSVCSR